MTVRADACKSMVEFNTHDVGIPENLVTNGTGEFTRKDAKFVKEVKWMRMRMLRLSEAERNQNHAAV